LKQVITTDRAPAPAGPYSQGISVDGIVYVAGQGGFDPTTGRLGETIEEQTEQTLQNVEAILEAAGASLADCVKATVHLSDLSLFDRFNAVYSRLMPEPRPVRTTVESTLARIDVEIDVVAHVGAGART
jgi:2-iminobutanoate/2-iminopropanoate deaminase